MSLREKGKERRRRRILQAAREILVESAGEGISVNAIAERAEVGQTTLYNLIGGLEDILDALVQEAFAGFTEVFNFDPTINPQTMIDQMVLASYEQLKKGEKENLAVLGYSYRQRAIKGIRAGARDIVFTLSDNVRLSLEHGKKEQLLHPDCNARILAGQMLLGMVVNLEQWMAGMASLKVYRAQCHLHLLLLLQGWSTEAAAARIREQVVELQIELEAAAGNMSIAGPQVSANSLK